MKVVKENAQTDNAYRNVMGLAKAKQDIYALVRNDVLMQCPKKFVNCNSNCPLFHMTKQPSGKIVVDVCCGKIPVHYAIEGDIQPFVETNKN